MTKERGSFSQFQVNWGVARRVESFILFFNKKVQRNRHAARRVESFKQVTSQGHDGCCSNLTERPVHIMGKQLLCVL